MREAVGAATQGVYLQLMTLITAVYRRIRPVNTKVNESARYCDGLTSVSGCQVSLVVYGDEDFHAVDFHQPRRQS